MNTEMNETFLRVDSTTIVARMRLFGKDADNGIVGTQDSIKVLQGFQNAFQQVARYYEPAISSEDFNLPVALSRGSFIAEIVQNWWAAPIIAGSVWFAKAFCEELGKQAGQNVGELFHLNKVDDFAKKMEQIPFLLFRIILIAKHLGGIGEDIMNSATIAPLANNNLELCNSSGEKLEITIEEMKIFKSCDQSTFSVLVTPLRQNLQLEYTCFQSGKQQNNINLTEEDKEFLYFPEDEEDDESAIVLPELEDGKYYELEGKINRVTEKTCSLGFFYQGHTITSIPADKQLAPYKNYFISRKIDQVLAKVRISGIIERRDFSSGFMRNRPVMIFDKLELLDDDDSASLF